MQGQVSMMYELCMASPMGARCHHVQTCLSCDRCYIARLAVVLTDKNYCIVCELLEATILTAA